MMNVIYNSENYYVVEYPAQHAFELVDKRAARSTFIQDGVAENFARSFQDAVKKEPSAEHIDEFLERYEALLSTPLVFH